MRVVIVILGLLVGMMDAYSQVFYVKDYSTHLPVPGANMLSLVNGESYVSNSDGKFVVDNLVTDDFFVISSVGYLDLYVTADDIQKQTEMFLFPRVNEIDPIQVVYSFGKEERKKDIPGQIDIIPASEIKLRNSQTSADILQSSGNVLVQKTQMGGGSPVLRGFEANRVLLVLDGVRMNNAIYRSGHLQNAITIDNNVLGQAEIIFGPGSVIYGSDALGGVVHFRTRDPKVLFNFDKEYS